jgi:hypothetical protein
LGTWGLLDNLWRGCHVRLLSKRVWIGAKDLSDLCANFLDSRVFLVAFGGTLCRNVVGLEGLDWVLPLKASDLRTKCRIFPLEASILGSKKCMVIFQIFDFDPDGRSP